jgi:hypothetical protein
MALSKIDLDKAGVTGTLPTSNLDTVGVAQGGTGITSGTTDQFLKFTGTTTLASSADNGNYVYLNKATSTSTASDITFDNFSATYPIYKIFCWWHNGTSNTTARFRLRNSSGDITSSIYRAAVSRVLLTSSEGNINGSASEYDVAQFRLGNGGSTFDDHRQAAEITVFRPSEPDSCMVHFKNSFWSSDNNEFVRWEGAGWCNTQEAHTGIKFYQSSGTINDYYYVIYGLKDS